MMNEKEAKLSLRSAQYLMLASSHQALTGSNPSNWGKQKTALVDGLSCGERGIRTHDEISPYLFSRQAP